MKALSARFSDKNLLTDPAECWSYGYDNSRRHAAPDAVVFPSSHEEVVALVRLCNAHKTPLIARGRGTGTTGATVPVSGGVVLSMERMNRLIEFSPENRYITTEPGMTNQALQEIAAKENFFWPPDPTSSAYCSIGGNLAYNSAGPRAVKYGTPRENCLGLRIVTGDGREMRVGTFTSKGVVGYDLTRLIIGSEGTLAIITEATLKLTPRPETKQTLQAIYSSVTSATKAVAQIMAQPETPCALEFIDKNAIDMVRQYSMVDLPKQAGALLMIEVDGNNNSIHHSVEAIKAAAKNDGLLSLETAQTKEEIEALWKTRKALSPSLRKIAPRKINEDVVVPVARLPELISRLDALSQKFNLPIVNFGHAGNGNIHVNLLIDPDNPGESEKASHCLIALFDLVLELNGTLSGEHGVGLEKRDYIEKELGREAIELMHSIKQQFDPLGILNPGKMLPL
ncbi:MAG: FAD-binding oxidoreductase [Gammaproteobacteria bacterium]|nr:MAG: FAD-binding oxidoreductase [Gammaproteobacteria bacterium]RLA21756.1 MAG: FAD-binding oxidoreductase [Gammaproteobacteria bacterium]